MITRTSSERGAYLAIATVLIMVLFVVMSIGYECARLMKVSNTLQGAADAAAGTGARALGQGRTDAQALDEAQNAFASNLGANGLTATGVVDITPDSSSTPRTISVNAEYPVNLTLMRAGAKFFGIPETRNVHVKSKAQVPIVAVQLVMDLSSSMNSPSFTTVPTPVANPSKFNALKSALPSLVTGLNAPYNHTGIVTFGSLANEAVPLAQNSGSHLTAMNATVAALALDTANPNTNLSEALRVARTSLAAAVGASKKELLLMTDGAPVGAIAAFHASSINALPARTVDAETGSAYLYRLLQDKTPKSFFTPGGTGWQWRNTGSFVILNSSQTRGYVYSATRLVNPDTNTPPSSCGVTVPAPPDVSGDPDGTMFVPGAVAVRRCGECGSFISSVVHWTGEVVTCGCDESRYGLPDSPVGTGWKRVLRAEYSSDCFKTTGNIKLQVSSTVSIDGTPMNRTIGGVLPTDFPRVDGPSPSDMVEVASNAFMVQAYMAHLNGIKIHGIVAGQSNHTLSANQEYQGYDPNHPRYLMMARVTRQKYAREDIAPFAVKLPLALLPDFTQLNPLPGPSSFSEEQQNLLFRSADANFGLWFQQVSSTRRMQFVPHS